MKNFINKPLINLKPELQYHTFENGLRLVYKQSIGTETSQLGFVVDVGSRDDDKSPGIAHCFEHMLFRGTHKRSSKQIINRIEEVGGELNAFTAKDITVVYANVLSGYLKRTLELLTDIVFNSKFTEQALALEKNIIKEEINIYLDTPEEFIFDEFIQHLYPNQPMGYNILGDEETLQKITLAQLNAFYEQYYQPKNMVLSIVSNMPFKYVLNNCRSLAVLTNSNKPIPKRNPPTPSLKFSLIKNREFNLAYTCIGQVIQEVSNAQKYQLMVLNNIIGGPGMNSLLNLSIREKHGLTYQIESSFTYYDNTAVWYILYATEEKLKHKTLRLVVKTLNDFAKNPLTERLLAKAKIQFANQLRMAEESKSSLMIYNGKQLLQHNEIESLSEYLAKVDTITAAQLHQALQEKMSYHLLSSLEILPEK